MGRDPVPPEHRDWLHPKEVQALFGVNNGTIYEWARKGRLTYVKTLGGHRRYNKTEVFELFNSIQKAEE